MNSFGVLATINSGSLFYMNIKVIFHSEHFDKEYEVEVWLTPHGSREFDFDLESIYERGTNCEVDINIFNDEDRQSLSDTIFRACERNVYDSYMDEAMSRLDEY